MDIVRRNLRHLIGDESILSVADRAQIQQSWLQRFMNPDKPSGIRKANHEKLSAIAKLYGVPVADLMTRDLTSEPFTPSQSPRLDPSIIVHTVEALHSIYSREGRDTEKTPLNLADPSDLDDFAHALVEAMKENTPVAVGTAVARAMEFRNAGGGNGSGASTAAGSADLGRTPTSQKRARRR